MSIYKKLAEARVRFQESNVKKSGFNKFSNFPYYELDDILPVTNRLNLEIGLLTLFSFTKETATLKIVDVDDGLSVEFSIPVVNAVMTKSNPIQELGATETYLRRYLLLAGYEITDADVVDSLPPNEERGNEQDLDKRFLEAWNKLNDEQKLKIGTKYPNKFGSPQNNPQYFKKIEKEEILAKLGK